MNQLSQQTRGLILRCLVEGCGLRQASRITHVDVNTVQWLMEDLGAACLLYHDENVRGLNCASIEADEIHSFVNTREKNLDRKKRRLRGIGETYTWNAIDPVTKLVVTWHVGKRQVRDANVFIADLASRLSGRIQLSTDGFRAYHSAVEEHFGDDVDYANLLKIFEDALSKMSAKQFLETQDHPRLKATKKVRISGNPDMETVGTSIIERFNLTVRMQLRRYARHTNGHSKKFENHVAMTSLFNFYYNFARLHKTIRCTPAMEAGISDHIWTDEEIVALLKYESKVDAEDGLASG